MSYSAILGNGPAVGRLRGIVKRCRVAHAFLLAGPHGVGKRLTALAFAQALVCRHPQEGEGCGSCPDCAAAAKGSHPSIAFIAHATDKREIVIEQIRNLQRELSFRSMDDRRRVALIDEAERMNEEGQNALLKTLEEPPDRTVIALITASPALVLPTIVSRCQTVLFTPLDDPLMIRFCRDTLSLDPATASIVMRLSAGSPGTAKAFASDSAGLQTRAQDLFSALATGELNTVVERASKIRDSEESRARAREQLTLLAFSLRDLLRSRITGVAADPVLVPPGLSRRLSAVDIEPLLERIETVLDHLRMIDQNANVPLVLEDALLQI